MNWWLHDWIIRCMKLIWNASRKCSNGRKRIDVRKSRRIDYSRAGCLILPPSFARSATVNFHGARRGKRASSSKKDRENKSSAGEGWRGRGQEKKGGYALRWQKEGNDSSGISSPPRATLVARWVAPLYLSMARTLIRTLVANLYMTARTRTAVRKSRVRSGAFLLLFHLHKRRNSVRSSYRSQIR